MLPRSDQAKAIAGLGIEWGQRMERAVDERFIAVRIARRPGSAVFDLSLNLSGENNGS